MKKNFNVLVGIATIIGCIFGGMSLLKDISATQKPIHVELNVNPIIEISTYKK